MSVEIIEHHIKIEKTAHYYTYGNALPTAKNIWIVFHGYGQLASSIIHKMTILNPNDNYVIAPEGMSRFYWKPNENKVGASWMTSKNRLNEIADYLSMLDKIYSEISNKCSKSVIWNVLGFSQGCQTAWRWILHKRPKISSFIHWAGGFPIEMDFDDSIEYLRSFQSILVYGKQDPLLNEKMINEITNTIRSNNFEMSIHPFEGTHKIDRQVLHMVLEKLDKI